MSNTNEKVLLRASLVGIMTGMRSMAGIATLSRHAMAHPRGFTDTKFAFLASPITSKLTTVGQFGEIVVDKLPFVGSRTDPQPLIGRMLFGAAAGVAVMSEARKPAVLGVLIGASSALVSSYAFYLLRSETGKALHLPDPIVALAEDAAVFGFGWLVESTYADD